MRVLTVFIYLFLFLFIIGRLITLDKPEWAHIDAIPPNYGNWDSFSLFEAHGQINVDNALYYDIGPMISQARKADVLVLGNSRPFFAFRDEIIREVEKKSGLKFFSLAGPGDNFPFSEEIILRNHLYPRFIIVNDDNFFDPKLWPFQKEAMTGSWWHSWSSTYMNYYQWLAKYYLRKFIPGFYFFKANQGKEFYILCSPENRFVFLENLSGERHPVVVDHKKSSINPIYLEQAQKFINDMQRRGSKVILTFVPDGKNPDFVKKEAKKLSVSCVLPKVEGLETFDGLHLTRESGNQFATAFFDIFLKLPDVQKAIKERKN
jgi:hypothetical protein